MKDAYSVFEVVCEAFKNYVILAKNITKATIQQLQTDGGGEYNSNAFRKYCQEKGDNRHLTHRNEME